MHFLWLWTAIVVGSLDVRDGTIVVLENSNRLVQSYTHSEVSHVAIIVNVQNEPWVYEATPGDVRRVRWNEYLAELGEFNRGRVEKHKLRVRLYQPNKGYSPAEVHELRSFLDSQLGRRYSLIGFVRNKEGDGIHCAQLVSTALIKTGRYQFDKTYCVSPGVLITTIQPTHAAPINIEVASPEAQETWCERSWNWWGGLFAWCGWAWWETLSYCR